MKLIKKRYGKTNSRQLYNRAVRHEIPGGEKLIDLLELLHKIRERGLDKTTHKVLTDFEDGLQAVRNAMVEEIQSRYSKPSAGVVEVQQLVTALQAESEVYRNESLSDFIALLLTKSNELLDEMTDDEDEE